MCLLLVCGVCAISLYACCFSLLLSLCVCAVLLSVGVLCFSMRRISYSCVYVLCIVCMYLLVYLFYVCLIYYVCIC